MKLSQFSWLKGRRQVQVALPHNLTFSTGDLGIGTVMSPPTPPSYLSLDAELSGGYGPF